MYTGTGVYSLPEASRLIGVQSREIRRWLYGYSYKRTVNGEPVRKFSAPLWTPQTSIKDPDEQVIGFHDLLEIRFVREFVRHGVPLAVVRRCLGVARDMYQVDYPFTTLQFKTDGRTIFGEAIKASQDDGSLTDLRTRQLVFKEIISPSLYDGIEYDGRQARKWYPLGAKKKIVLDPGRQFGSPIVEETGTPTSVLFASFLAEGRDETAMQRTASSYAISLPLVRAAVTFEQGLKRTVH